MTIDTARCNGKRVLSYIDLNYPFAAATHRPCPGCPDCAPQKSEPDCTEPAPSHAQSMVLRSMADSHSNDEVRSMARELLSARSRIAELESNKCALQSVYAVAVEDQEIKAERIAELEAYVRSVANNPDCAQASCGIGARALLPKESDNG